MKKKGIIILMLIIVASGGALYGQEKKSRKQRRAEQTEIRIKEFINSQNYIFTGGSNMATGDKRYHKRYVIVTKERIETTILPQYSDGSQFKGGNPFSYREFEYKIENSEKGGWDVYIKIENERMKIVSEMFMTISPSGNAVLTLKQHPWSTAATYIGRIDGPKPNGKF